MRLVPSAVAVASLLIAGAPSRRTGRWKAFGGKLGGQEHPYMSASRGPGLVNSKLAAAIRRLSAACLLPNSVLMWLCVVASLHGCRPNAEHFVARDQPGASTLVRDTMRIHFERSGGFTGLALAATVESDTLSQQDELRLRELIDEAGFFELPAVLHDTASVADQFRYKVTVEMAGRSHTVEASEGAVPPPLRPLLEWLGRAARRRIR